MIHAYPEIFLRKAMIKTGDLFDFAIHEFGMDGEDLAVMFAGSTVAARLERGEPKYLAGMCGAELAILVLEEKSGKTVAAEIGEHYHRTPDYWCGWAMCYYQWLRGISYKEILEIAPYQELRAMYKTLHEADIEKFVEAMDARRRSTIPETRLKRLRVAYGCSQSELARRSGVSLRSIQMYEQRKKDINRAQSASLLSLARALGCGMEELLEPV